MFLLFLASNFLLLPALQVSIWVSDSAPWHSLQAMDDACNGAQSGAVALVCAPGRNIVDFFSDSTPVYTPGVNLPIASSNVRTNLFASATIWSFGGSALSAGVAVVTACNQSGYFKPDADCANWTLTNATTISAGTPAVPSSWIVSGTASVRCSDTMRIYCAGGDLILPNSTAGLISGSAPCLPPAYQGPAGNCTCANGYAGIVANGVNVTGCVGIPCPSPAYMGASGQCTCNNGYVGTVNYSQGYAAGCTPLCTPPIYMGFPGSCTCGTGFRGVVSLVSGLLTGCEGIPCLGAYTGVAGECTCALGFIGNVSYTGNSTAGCQPAPCIGPAYTGSAGQCQCANGFIGTVVYTPLGATGCVGVVCSGPAFVGVAGQCQCAAGYNGSVSYIANAVTGCVLIGNLSAVPCVGPAYVGSPGNCQCARGYAGLAVNTPAGQTGCVAVPCPLPAYDGQPGQCTCRPGYAGNVAYSALQLPTGCEPLCAPPQFTGAPGACTCGLGFQGQAVNVAGVLTGCVGIPCVGPAFVGLPGQCTCAVGYSGVVSYSANSTVGCVMAGTTNCMLPAYEGLPGLCTCAPGYSGVVKYIGNIATGCVGLGTGMMAQYQSQQMTMEVTGVQVMVAPSPEYPPNGTMMVSTSDSTGSAAVSSKIVTIVYMSSSNETQNISNLSTPVRFIMPLQSGGEKSVMVCGGGGAPQEMAPACGWYDHDKQAWSTQGCTTSNLTNTSVECSCSHFTEFACIIPQSNRVPTSEYLQLTPANISLHPGGVITVTIVLVIFFIALAISIRIDEEEKHLHKTEDVIAKRAAKWDRALTSSHLNDGVGKGKEEGGEGGMCEGSNGGRMRTGSVGMWWKTYRTGLQTHHTWGSILWRRKGTSFRSVDRTFVTLNLVLSMMCLSASFHARNNTFLGRIEVIIFSLLGSFPPSILLMHLFSHTGEMGAIETWQLDKGLIKPSQLRCLRYRFAERWKWVWYGVVLCAAVGMVWYILSIALMFDQNPWYYCRGETTTSWIVDFMLPYAISIFGVEPIKIGLLVGVKHMAQQQQHAAHRRMTEDVNESVSAFNVDNSVEPSVRVDLPTPKGVTD